MKILPRSQVLVLALLLFPTGRAAAQGTREDYQRAEHFFQWMVVDPADGSVNVIFYDRSGDPRNRAQTVTLARPTDGGQSFQKIPGLISRSTPAAASSAIITAWPP